MLLLPKYKFCPDGCCILAIALRILVAGFQVNVVSYTGLVWVLASANQITIAGQITSTARIKIGEIVREKLKEIGYDNEKTDISVSGLGMHIFCGCTGYEESLYSHARFVDSFID